MNTMLISRRNLLFVAIAAILLIAVGAFLATR
jgi:hypothetical protein